jgi:hypothetical protein
MSTAVEVLRPVALEPSQSSAPIRVLQVPWRDPSTVSKQELAAHISALEKACLDNPRSADLRTCLGMAYAMNYNVYKSMDALETAVNLDPTHFFGQFKLSELFYRLRALPRAEQETLKAVHLAQNGWELSLARKQLQEIRRLIHDGTQKPAWTKSLKVPAMVLIAMVVVFSLLMVVTK